MDLGLGDAERWDELDTSSTGSASSSSLLSGWDEDEVQDKIGTSSVLTNSDGHIGELSLDNENFSPKLFLANSMGDLAMDELEDRLQSIRDLLEEKTSHVHGLNKKNFRRFNNCYEGVLQLNRKLKQRGPTAGPVAIETICADLGGMVTGTFSPLIGRAQEIRRRRSVLGVLARFQKSFVVPAVMRENLAAHDFKLVVRDYQKAMALRASLGDKHLILRQMYAEVEAIAAELRRELFTLLESPTLPLLTARTFIGLLAGLNTKESGTLFTVSFRAKRIIRLFELAKEAHDSTLAAPPSSVPDSWLQANADLTGDQLALQRLAKAAARGLRSLEESESDDELEGDGGSADELDSTAWSDIFSGESVLTAGGEALGHSHRLTLAFATHLSRIASETLPDLWELGRQLYEGGGGASGSVGAGTSSGAAAGMTPADAQASFVATAKTVVTRHAELALGAFWGVDRSRASGDLEPHMTETLKTIAFCYRTLIEKGMPAEVLAPLLGALDEASAYFVRGMCARMLALVSHVTADTSRAFDAAVAARVAAGIGRDAGVAASAMAGGETGDRGSGAAAAGERLLDDFMVHVRYTMDALAAVVPGGLALNSQIQDALFEAMRVLLDGIHGLAFSRWSDTDRAANSESRKALLSLLAVLAEVHGGGFDALAEHVFTRFGWPLDEARAPLKGVMRLVAVLRDLLVAKYVRWQSARLHPLIWEGILATGTDLAAVPVAPTAVRPYTMEALLLVVLIHAELFAMAPAFVTTILSSVTEDLGEAYLHCVRELPPLSEHAVGQLMVDIEFSDLVLAPFATDRSVDAFEAAIGVVESRLAKGSLSSVTKKLAKGLIAESLNSTAVQFACFADK